MAEGRSDFDAPGLHVDARADETVQIRLPGGRRTQLQWVVIVVMGACLALLVVVSLRTPLGAFAGLRHAGQDRDLREPAASASAVVPAPASSAWTAIVTPPSAPSSGTITVAPNAGPIVVDGIRAHSSTVMVVCGQHRLRVGRGQARDVVVPCGGTLGIERGGRTSVR